MSDIERIDQRLSAVERAVVDSDVELDQLADLAALAEDLDRLEARFEEHERRIATLEGTVDALDGFAGNVDSQNENVEKQADAAIAAVDRLEYRIDELEDRLEERRSHSSGETADISTADQTGTNPPALEGADGAHGSGGTEHPPGIAERQAGAASTTDSFGEEADAEGTAGTLLEEPATESGPETSEADETPSDGLAVQQTIERRLSGSDGDSLDDTGSADTESSDIQDSSGGEDRSEPAGEETDDSSGLFASLRARLS